MKVISARQLWHDAFDTASVEPDYNTAVYSRSRRRYQEILKDENGKIIGRVPMPITHATETRVGRGGAGGIVDGCEKGIVLRAIEQIRKRDYLAYCWGMAAYAPPANRFKERSALLAYMLAEYETWEFDFPRKQRHAAQLALFCLQSSCIRDATGRRADLRLARKIVGDITRNEWTKTWKKPYRRWQYLLEKLPPRALGPVADLVPRLRGIREDG